MFSKAINAFRTGVWSRRMLFFRAGRTLNMTARGTTLSYPSSRLYRLSVRGLSAKKDLLCIIKVKTLTIVLFLNAGQTMELSRGCRCLEMIQALNIVL